MTTFILHGLGGDSQENWFPWLRAELERRRRDVIVPDFPNAGWPIYAHWAAHFEQYAEKIDHETVMIGHSLGCPFALRYLSDRGLRIAHLILVAPPFTDVGWDSLTEMMSGIPPEHARDTADRFSLLASDDDPYIPQHEFQQYGTLLGIEPTILHAREHLWQPEIPEVLELLT